MPCLFLFFLCGFCFYLCFCGCLLVSVSSRVTRGVNLWCETSRSETTCPLCKGLCNTIVPHTPAHIAVVAPDASSHKKHSESLLQEKLTADSLFDGVDAMLQGPSELLLSSSADLAPGIDLLCDALRSQYSLPWRDLQESNKSVFWDDSFPELALMRSVQSLLSAAAYSIQSMVWARRSISAAVQEEGKVQRNADWIIQLVRVVRQIATLFDSEDDFYEAIVGPLRRLLSGSSSSILDEYYRDLDAEKGQEGEDEGFRLQDVHQCSANDLRKVLLTLPFTAVGTSRALSPKRMSLILHRCRERELVDSDFQLWAWLQQPLLTQDLHVVAMAALSSTSQLGAAVDACGLLSLARLVQILLEPTVTGVYQYMSVMAATPSLSSVHGTTSSTHSLDAVAKGKVGGGGWEHDSKRQKMMPTSTDDTAADEGDHAELVSRLEELLRLVGDMVGISYPDLTPLAGTSLLSHVVDAWLPFLEYASALKDALQTTTRSLSLLSPSSSPVDLSSRLLCAGELLDRLGLGSSVQQCVAQSGLNELAGRWSEQMRNAKSFMSSIKVDEDVQDDFEDICGLHDSDEDGAVAGGYEFSGTSGSLQAVTGEASAAGTDQKAEPNDSRSSVQEGTSGGAGDLGASLWEGEDLSTLEMDTAGIFAGGVGGGVGGDEDDDGNPDLDTMGMVLQQLGFSPDTELTPVSNTCTAQFFII